MSDRASSASNEHGKHRPARIILAVIAAVVVTLAVAMAVYLNTGIYHADATARAALASDASVSVTRGDGTIAFAGPDDDPANTYGLVFYPGAKVDADAYAPLLRELAAQSWLCVAVEMPFDIAFFDSDAAGDVIEAYPQVEHWYAAGHSLGGVVASGYAAAHEEQLDGLVLLASYPTADLSGSGLQVLRAYGANDGVLNREAYEQAASKLPADGANGSAELVIAGGNHAQFGSYGAQAGDGVATISAAEQIGQTVEFVDEVARG